MAWVGIGHRPELVEWIAARPEEVECLEITAEHFFDGGDAYLRRLSRDYPLFVHGLGLSLGTPGPLSRPDLDQFARVVELANPEWISEHVAFSRTDEVDLGHLNPIEPSRKMLDEVANHAKEVSQRCSKPLLLENITTHLEIHGELREPEFLNKLCQKAGCSLLLDVTNLFINSQNHGFDAQAWLHELDPVHIVQLHVVGYAQRDDRFLDTHAEDIQKDLWELIHAVFDYASVKAVIIERDNNFPPVSTLEQELRLLKKALADS